VAFGHGGRNNVQNVTYGRISNKGPELGRAYGARFNIWLLEP